MDEGRAENRVGMLVSMARRRFGEAVASTMAALLEPGRLGGRAQGNRDGPVDLRERRRPDCQDSADLALS